MQMRLMIFNGLRDTLTENLTSPQCTYHTQCGIGGKVATESVDTYLL